MKRVFDIISASFMSHSTVRYSAEHLRVPFGVEGVWREGVGFMVECAWREGVSGVGLGLKDEGFSCVRGYAGGGYIMQMGRAECRGSRQ